MKKQTLLLFYMDSIYWTKFGKTWEDRFAGKVGGGGGGGGSTIRTILYQHDSIQVDSLSEIFLSPIQTCPPNIILRKNCPIKSNIDFV